MKPRDESVKVVATTDEPTQPKPPGRRPQVILEGDAIRIRVPIRMRHRNNRREVVVTTAEEPPPQEALVRAIARAYYWQELLDSGELRSISALASRFDVDHSYVARTLRLAGLSPEIVEMILAGKEPDSLSLRYLAKGFPIRWAEQAANLCVDSEKPTALFSTPDHR